MANQNQNPPVTDEPAPTPPTRFVKFLQDYRGKLTAEQFYLSGEVVEFPAEVAEKLIAAGRAKGVRPVAKPKVEPETEE